MTISTHLQNAWLTDYLKAHWTHAYTI